MLGKCTRKYLDWQFLCPGPESNRHALITERRILSPLRLPIPPPGQETVMAGICLDSDVWAALRVSPKRLMTFRRSILARNALDAFLEATAGIEPAHRDFADLRITTFLRGRRDEFQYRLSRSKYKAIGLAFRRSSGGLFLRGRFQNQRREAS